MRGTKVILEEIDDAELEFQRESMAAKSVYEKARVANRDFSDSENRTFDIAVSAAKGTKLRLHQLRTELDQVQNQQRQIVMSRHPSATVYGQMNSGAPDRVLPTNGILPGDEPQFPSYSVVAKPKAFVGEHGKALAYASGMWLRAVIAREFNHGVDSVAEDYCSRLGWQVTNVGTEGSGVGGGYTVPAPLGSVIMEVREAVGVARRAALVMPMSSDTLTFPRKTSGLTVYYPGEAQALTLSDVGWGQVELIAKKRATAHQMSQELVDDSIIGMVDYIFREMSYALADREDAEYINGDATSAYGSVTGLKAAIGAGGISTCATGHDTWPEIDLADIMAWIGLLPDRYHARQPKIICSAAFFYSVLTRAAIQAGGTTLANLMGGGGVARNFMGHEVLTTQYMPTSTAVSTVCAFFGAFDTGSILGERTGIRIARSDDYAFLNDVTTLKATSRYDLEIFDQGTASVPGCYVGLKTAA